MGSNERAEPPAASRAVEPRAWIVRAGREGESEALALSEGVAVIGWGQLPDLSEVVSSAKLRALYERERPGTQKARVSAQVGQIYRFVRDMRIGDVVVLPLKSQPDFVAVGRVVGEYQYQDAPPYGEDARHTRPVEWLSKGTSYAAFDVDLLRAFGVQGTVRRIRRPNAAARLLTACSSGDAQDLLHLVVKWAARLREDTLERHVEVAESKGAVWWGLSTSSDPEWKTSQSAVDRLRAQLTAGLPTHVFIVGPSSEPTCWQTNLLAVEYERAAVEEELIPSYYDSAQHHHLWVKLAEFQPRDRDWLLRSLDPARATHRGKPVALGNQTNPLLVRFRSEPRVWWVNQGSSFSRAREGGHIWAPVRDQRDREHAHWRALKELPNSAECVIQAPLGWLTAAELRLSPNDRCAQMPCADRVGHAHSRFRPIRGFDTAARKLRSRGVSDAPRMSQ